MHDSGMEFLQLKPNVHAVWSTPTTLRFGIDTELVVLDNPAPRTERLVAALRTGMPTTRFDGVAQAFGVNRAERETLLNQLEPVLSRTAERHARQDLSVHVEASQTLSEPFRTALLDAGHRLTAAEKPDLVLLIAHFVIPPRRARAWLTRGIPHLPVVFSDSAVRIGPLVRAGGDPCVFCIDSAHTEREPAWPAIASQCLTRTSPLATPEFTLPTAAAVIELVDAWRRGEQTVSTRQYSLSKATPVGVSVSHTPVASHPACYCSLGDAAAEFCDKR